MTSTSKKKNLRTFVKEHQKELRAHVRQAVPNLRGGLSLDDLEDWVLNDEGLYRWAQSENVDV